MTWRTIVVASRNAKRAESAVTEVSSCARRQLTGADDLGAAKSGPVVTGAVSRDGHGELIGQLAAPPAGKSVVHCVNPLSFDKQGASAVPVANCLAAQHAAPVRFRHETSVEATRDVEQARA